MSSIGRYCIATFLGILISVVCTLLTTSLIIEITINRRFAFYLGFMFFIVGVLLFWRNYLESKKDSSVIITRSSEHFYKCTVLIYVYALMTILTGILFIAFRKDWFTKISFGPRMIFLIIFTITTCFFVIYLVIDVFSTLLGICGTRLIIEGKQQARLMIIATIIIGIMYGVRLGVLDDDDDEIYKITMIKLQSDGFRYTLGILVGIIIGYFNEVLSNYGEDSTIKIEDSN